MTEHPECPHCTCRWDDGAPAGMVNKAAPFYPLVELIERVTPRNQYDRDRRIHTPSTPIGAVIHTDTASSTVTRRDRGRTIDVMEAH